MPQLRRQGAMNEDDSATMRRTRCISFLSFARLAGRGRRLDAGRSLSVCAYRYFARPVKPWEMVGIAMIAFRALGVPHVP